MTPVLVRVDVSSAVPPYEQVRIQIADLILSGQLPQDERLPTVRQLAADLGLAVATVARSYRELEAAGLVTSRRGAGTRVTFAARNTPALDEQLAQAARVFVTTGRGLAASDDQLLAAVRLALTTDHE
ncbi:MULTISPECIES: GntR family transcriptional regulator [unclassified Streptomyces]|uniref:GntR family transcriptional regulator n=1 Tax=unclassified Streptomyces TaxID=2593676 RepID=UPI003804E66B